MATFCLSLARAMGHEWVKILKKIILMDLLFIWGGTKWFWGGHIHNKGPELCFVMQPLQNPPLCSSTELRPGVPERRWRRCRPCPCPGVAPVAGTCPPAGTVADPRYPANPAWPITALHSINNRGGQANFFLSPQNRNPWDHSAVAKTGVPVRKFVFYCVQIWIRALNAKLGRRKGMYLRTCWRFQVHKSAKCHIFAEGPQICGSAICGTYLWTAHIL